jgi:hypothetical protein
MLVRYARPTIIGGVAENKPQGRGEGLHVKLSTHFVTAIFQGFTERFLSAASPCLSIRHTKEGPWYMAEFWQVGRLAPNGCTSLAFAP